MVYGLRRKVWRRYRLKIYSLLNLGCLWLFYFYFDLVTKLLKVQWVNLFNLLELGLGLHV